MRIRTYALKTLPLCVRRETHHNSGIVGRARVFHSSLPSQAGAISVFPPKTGASVLFVCMGSWCVQAELSKEQFEGARAAFKAEGEGQSRIGLHSVQRALLRYVAAGSSDSLSSTSKSVQSWSPRVETRFQFPEVSIQTAAVSCFSCAICIFCPSVCLSICLPLVAPSAVYMAPGKVLVEPLLSPALGIPGQTTYGNDARRTIVRVGRCAAQASTWGENVASADFSSPMNKNSWRAWGQFLWLDDMVIGTGK